VAALDIQFLQGSVFLPQLGLWLDAHRRQTGAERVLVSHAHSDHIGRHREVILTPGTARLMGKRLGGQRQEHCQEYLQPVEYQGTNGPFRVTLLPAGHILGSAMAWIEAEGQTLLYTGDFKLRPGLTAEPCQPRRADILITETTFGRPKYRLPPAAQVLGELVRFCQETLARGETALLLAYSLGKSQELIQALGSVPLPIVVHETVFRLAQVYAELGQALPAHTRLEGDNYLGKVLICPPQALPPQLKPPATGQGVRRAVATGWAMDASCRYRFGVEAAFPLSDHADFQELLEFVRLVSPKEVLTLHGFAADFAQTLRNQGYAARALGVSGEQLELGPAILGSLE
jgi:Cft2 family RNA processing exonuclease